MNSNIILCLSNCKTTKYDTHRNISHITYSETGDVMPAGVTGAFLSRTHIIHTGVCETNTPFVRALALQSGSGNRNPAQDLVFSKLIFQPVFLSGGAVFSQTPVGSLPETQSHRF